MWQHDSSVDAFYFYAICGAYLLFIDKNTADGRALQTTVNFDLE